MNARLRISLLVSLVAVGLFALAPTTAEAQRGYVARSAVNGYLNGAYGGYGGYGYGYQPQYYGGYGAYGGNGYGYGYGGYGNWTGYNSSYPAYGYNAAYGYGSYPAYGYRGSYYGY